MENIEIVQRFEADYSLDEYTPYFIFLEEFLLLLVVNDLLVEVAVVSELHDDAICMDRYHKFLPSKKTSL